MRPIQRQLAVLALSSLAVTMLASAAHADTETTVIDSVGPGSEWDTVRPVVCGSTQTGTGTATLVTGPGQPPTGTGSLQLQAPAGQYVELFNTWGWDPFTLSELEVDANNSGVWSARVMVYTPAAQEGGEATWLYDLYTDGALNASWHTVDLMAATTDWYRYEFGDYGTAPVHGSLSSLLAIAPAGSRFEYSLQAFGCGHGTTQTAYLDNQVWGFSNGDRWVNDFEQPVSAQVPPGGQPPTGQPPTGQPPATLLPATVTAKPAKKAVRAGRKLVVKGSTSPAKDGQRVTLWQVGKKAKRLGTGVVHGASFKLVKRLKKPGRYKLYVTVDADATSLSGTSAVFKVRVVR